MNAKLFVDTNILVYSRDASEPDKQTKALEWLSLIWKERSGRISYQVLNEYYVTVTQRLKPGLNKDEARSDINDLQSWKPTTVDRVVIDGAWSIQDQYELSWWDCLILSAALKLDCQYLLTEDMQHDQNVGGLRLVNPFITKPEELL